MAIGTGAVSMSDIRTEWGRSGAISMSEMYRGGSHVRSKAANNTGTNLASTVPESGVIRIDDFRGSAAGFRYTFTATATNQNASDLFGDDYAVDYRKEIVINSGVELGATSTAEEALEIDSGGAGTIVVTNNGTLSGAGGAAGSDGGDAFEAAVNCTFVNNGTVRAGGGGGGNGGTGGEGSTQTLNTADWSGREPPTWWSNGSASAGHYWNSSSYHWLYTGGVSYIIWGSNIGSQSGFPSTITIGSNYYGRGNHRGGGKYEIYRQNFSTTIFNGGSGGSGGVGEGYNQSSGSGGSGGTGGTNAGNGGSGGTGGSYGSGGTAGTTGTNGNHSNAPAAPDAGGAGKYLRGSSFVTFTNNGTVLGGTA